MPFWSRRRLRSVAESNCIWCWRKRCDRRKQTLESMTYSGQPHTSGSFFVDLALCDLVWLCWKYLLRIGLLSTDNFRAFKIRGLLTQSPVVTPTSDTSPWLRVERFAESTVVVFFTSRISRRLLHRFFGRSTGPWKSAGRWMLNHRNYFLALDSPRATVLWLAPTVSDNSRLAWRESASCSTLLPSPLGFEFRRHELRSHYTGKERRTEMAEMIVGACIVAVLSTFLSPLKKRPRR